MPARTQDYACNADPNAGRSERDETPPAQPERKLPGLGIAFHYSFDLSCDEERAGIVDAGRDVVAHLTVATDEDYADIPEVFRSQLRISRYGFEALQSSIPGPGATAICIFHAVAAEI